MILHHTLNLYSMKYLLPLLFFSTVFFAGCSSATDSGEDSPPGTDPPPTPTQTLTVEVDPEGAGTVTPASGEFDKGSEIEMKATASENWIFAGWDGDVTGSDNPTKVGITKDLYVLATFEKMEHALNVKTQGEGSVEQKLIPAKSYEHGSTVELTAKPAKKWAFIEWQGDLSGSENPASILVDQNREVTAVFEQIHFETSTSVKGKGSVSLSPEKDLYEEGEAVEATATPDAGWHFVKWSDGSTDNPLSFQIDGDKSLEAVFEINAYALNVDVTGSGKVVLDPEKALYDHGEKVKLTATRDPGWNFAGWSGDLTSTENPVTVQVEKELNITATFDECTDPQECTTSVFYASTLISGRVFGSTLQFRNDLSSDITLKSLTIRNKGGTVVAQDNDINEVLQPGKVKGMSASYSPQPTLDDFLEFTAEWVFDYDGAEHSVFTESRTLF